MAQNTPAPLPERPEHPQSDFNSEVPKASKSALLLLCVFLFLLTCFVAWGIWKAAFPPKAPLQGQMESRTVSISSKVAGRVEKILVREGEPVEAGSIVAELSLPELEAKLSQVKAQERAAQAKQSLVDEGARPQEKAAALAQWERAKAGADLAKKTFERISALYRDGLISKQKFDEVQAQWISAREQAAAAKEQYDIALTGARAQEKSAAADLAAEAQAGVRQVQSLTEDKLLRAPVAGEVEKVILTQGELAAAGFPILTLVNLADQWAVFNIREENMPSVKMNRILKGRIPALGEAKADFQIYYISPRANYATWRSTRMDSGYDMKTFEVRARPVTKVEGLRPGMSVLIDDYE